MATLIITRGGHEYWQARKTFPDAKVYDISQVRKYFQGVVWDEIQYTRYCRQSPNWAFFIEDGLAYQQEKGAKITCLDS